MKNRLDDLFEFFDELMTTSIGLCTGFFLFSILSVYIVKNNLAIKDNLYGLIVSILIGGAGFILFKILIATVCYFLDENMCNNENKIISKKGSTPSPLPVILAMIIMIVAYKISIKYYGEKQVIEAVIILTLILCSIVITIRLVSYINKYIFAKFISKSLGENYKSKVTFGLEDYDDNICIYENNELVYYDQAETYPRKDYLKEFERIKNRIELKKKNYLKPVYKIIEEVSFSDIEKYLSENSLFFCEEADFFSGCAKELKCEKCEKMPDIIRQFKETFFKLKNTKYNDLKANVLSFTNDGLDPSIIKNMSLEDIISCKYDGIKYTYDEIYKEYEELVIFIVKLIQKINEKNTSEEI